MNTRIHRIKSFAYANAKLANQNITMDMVDQCFPEAHIKASVFLHQYLSGRSSVSKPVPGQWYDLNGSRIWFIGYDACGVAFAQGKNTLPFIMPDDDVSELAHLPDCTGWDWQPETFPQWIVHESGSFIDGGFLKRISPDRVIDFNKNGSSTEKAWSPDDAALLRCGKWKQITEQQALALLDEPVEVKQEPPVPDFASAVGFVETTICKDDDLMWTWHCQIAMAIQDEMGSRIAHADANRCAARAMKMLFGADVEKTKHWNITVKPQPAEDPEEWVEITDPEHVLRGGVDFVRHHQGTVWVDIEASGGVKVKEYSWTERFLFRCRRKDLPAKKRTVTVPKWLVINDANTFIAEQTFRPSGAQVHRVGETTYKIQE